MDRLLGNGKRKTVTISFSNKKPKLNLKKSRTGLTMQKCSQEYERVCLLQLKKNDQAMVITQTKTVSNERLFLTEKTFRSCVLAQSYRILAHFLYSCFDGCKLARFKAKCTENFEKIEESSYIKVPCCRFSIKSVKTFKPRVTDDEITRHHTR